MTFPKTSLDLPTRADKRFNFACLLTDSVGWPLGAALFSQATILPAFLQHLGASNVLIGALPALYNLLVFLPGLFVAGYVSRLQRARGYLFWIALAERLALLALVPLTLLWARTHPGWLIAALFIAITIHAGAMGLNQPAYWIVVGKCVPPAWRGRLYGYAGGLSGLLSLALAPVMEHLLSGPGGGFPTGYAHGFLLGAVILLVSFFPLGLVREPPGLPRGEDDPHTGHYGRDSMRVWRTQTPFRRFLYGQIALTLSSLAVPFYVLDARARLGAGSEAVAGYTALLVLAGSFGGLGVGAWSDKRGNRAVLLAACACAALASLVALAAPNKLVFYGVFALLALAAAAQGIAGNNIVMEYAGDSREIPLYTAVYNAVTALPRAFAPLAGGLLADGPAGYHTLFLLSAAFAAGAFALTLRAGEPRHRRPVSAILSP